MFEWQIPFHWSHAYFSWYVSVHKHNLIMTDWLRFIHYFRSYQQSINHHQPDSLTRFIAHKLRILQHVNVWQSSILSASIFFICLMLITVYCVLKCLCTSQRGCVVFYLEKYMFHGYTDFTAIRDSMNFASSTILEKPFKTDFWNSGKKHQNIKDDLLKGQLTPKSA